MITLLKIAITLAIGAGCGLLFKKLKVPAAFMIGALVGAAVFSVITSEAYMPSQTKFVVQVIAGGFIGCSLEKSDLKRLPYIVKPMLIMFSGLIILNFAAGLIIYMTSPLDLLTSFMSVVPGGVNDTPIVAEDMGADGPKVAVMQLVRQVLGIGVFPVLIEFYSLRSKNETSATSVNEIRLKSNNRSYGSLAATVVIALCAGALGKISGLPSGTFVFSIVAILILKLVFDYAFMPKWLKKCAQVCSGCYLGSSITTDDILELRYLIIPVMVIILGYGLNCWFTGKVISKVCRIPHKEAMLITTPAGASDMALILEDLEVQNTDIVVLQVLRAVVVMSVFPMIIGFTVNVVS